MTSGAHAGRRLYGVMWRGSSGPSSRSRRYAHYIALVRMAVVSMAMRTRAMRTMATLVTQQKVGSLWPQLTRAMRTMATLVTQQKVC